MSKPIAISIDNISFTYPSNDHKSLDQISLAIKSQACTGIIGPNGAGKSTLISALCGLLVPQQGAISYLEKPQRSIESVVKQQVALIPQEYAFYPELSIVQNLKFFISLTKQPQAKQRQVLEQVLEQCQLQAVQHQKAASLSGGYKRRLNIAIALSKEPSIIFLDEPTVGIDPISRAQIIELLTRLKQQGKTLIYTSRVCFSEVETLCDEVFLLNGGRAIGTSEINTNNSYLTIELVDHSDLNKFSNLFLANPQELKIPLEIQVKDQAHFQYLLNELSVLGDFIKQLHFSKNSLDHLYFNSYQESSC